MTDLRLAEDLARAASVAAAWGDFDPTKKQYLEGWAQAAKLLDTLVGIHKYTEAEGCPACEARKAITKFITAMLGKRDG